MAQNSRTYLFMGLLLMAQLSMGQELHTTPIDHRTMHVALRPMRSERAKNWTNSSYWAQYFWADQSATGYVRRTND